MSGINAINRISLERREYDETGPAKIRSNISSVLDRSSAVSGGPDELIKNIIDTIHSNPDNIAKAVTEDTGKPISASNKEVAASLCVLASYANKRFEDWLYTGEERKNQVPMRQGISVVFPDVWCPVLSLIERIVPSILSRKLTVVSLDNRAFTAAKMLLDQLDPDIALGSGLVTTLLKDRGRTLRVLKKETISDILFSGSVDGLSSLGIHGSYPSVRAEFGEGFSVMVTADAKLDECAVSIADLFLDYSRSPFRRPANVFVEEPVQEYFENRLIEEISKHHAGDPFSDEASIGVVSDPEVAGVIGSLLISGRNRTLDLPYWNGFEKNIFYPALIREQPDSPTLNGFKDLPILKVSTMSSIKKGFDSIVRSGNLMFTSIWSSDPYMEDMARDTLHVSSLYFNALPGSLPAEWRNPLVNENLVQGPEALARSMLTRKTILH
ncbi:MAG: aldehyde dehydrogenase family protein [Candidatus Thermoplasmatota archaeon]|nr:aldehyde dehydrogenase family protein [Candidatus Thermoplasmatota archaeon]